jgi:hypothetical protein
MGSFEPVFGEFAFKRFAPGLTFRSCVVVPEMDRRRLMLMAGVGLLAAAIPARLVDMPRRYGEPRG